MATGFHEVSARTFSNAASCVESQVVALINLYGYATMPARHDMLQQTTGWLRRIDRLFPSWPDLPPAVEAQMAGTAPGHNGEGRAAASAGLSVSTCLRFAVASCFASNFTSLKFALRLLVKPVLLYSKSQAG
jgi:hypothetical protein